MKKAQQNTAAKWEKWQNKGSATAYIAKYIAKNIIDGFLGPAAGEVSDEDPTLSHTTMPCVFVHGPSRWASRQFQFYGRIPLQVWRELRRLIPA